MSLKYNLLAVFPTIDSEKESDDLKEIRKTAIKNFDAKGFPTRKEEAWKYTSLNPILREEYKLDFQDKKVDAEKIKSYFLPNADTYKVVFVNGKLHEDLSTVGVREGITINTLAKAKQDANQKEIVAKHYNQIAEEASMVELNTAFNQDGLFVYVKQSVIVDKPIELFNFATGEEDALLLQPIMVMVAEANTQVQIIERLQCLTESATLTNVVSVGFSVKLW